MRAAASTFLSADSSPVPGLVTGWMLNRVTAKVKRLFYTQDPRHQRGWSLAWSAQYGFLHFWQGTRSFFDLHSPMSPWQCLKTTGFSTGRARFSVTYSLFLNLDMSDSCLDLFDHGRHPGIEVRVREELLLRDFLQDVEDLRAGVPHARLELGRGIGGLLPDDLALASIVEIAEPGLAEPALGVRDVDALLHHPPDLGGDPDEPFAVLGADLELVPLDEGLLAPDEEDLLALEDLFAHDRPDKDAIGRELKPGPERPGRDLRPIGRLPVGKDTVFSEKVDIAQDRERSPLALQLKVDAVLDDRIVPDHPRLDGRKDLPPREAHERPISFLDPFRRIVGIDLPADEPGLLLFLPDLGLPGRLELGIEGRLVRIRAGRDELPDRVLQDLVDDVAGDELPARQLRDLVDVLVLHGERA